MKTEPGKDLIDALKYRFAQNMHRHPTADWADIQARLQRRPDALRSLLDYHNGAQSYYDARDFGSALRV